MAEQAGLMQSSRGEEGLPIKPCGFGIVALHASRALLQYLGKWLEREELESYTGNFSALLFYKVGDYRNSTLQL